MDSLFSIIQTKPKVEVKAPKYRWQDIALEIIKELRLPKTEHWVVWTLYKRKGETALNSLLEEIRQGEIKSNPIIYIKWLLKSK